MKRVVLLVLFMAVAAPVRGYDKDGKYSVSGVGLKLGLSPSRIG